MSKQQSQSQPSRRKFLTGAAAAATGAATLGFPAIVKAQGPISMRWQSTWPAKDIFHEYANDFAKKDRKSTRLNSSHQIIEPPKPTAYARYSQS